MNYLMIIIVVFIFMMVIWRLSSKRYVIPCPSWLAWIVEMDNPFAKENRSASIIGHLDLNHDMNIADVGSGPGRVAIPLAQQLKTGSTLLVVDMQSEVLKKVKRKSMDIENIEFSQGALGDGVLEKNKYDYILLVNVLGEIPKRQKALQETFDALKEGGILSVTENIFAPYY